MKISKVLPILLLPTMILSLSSCTKENSKEDKETIDNIVNKYNKGEVTLPVNADGVYGLSSTIAVSATTEELGVLSLNGSANVKMSEERLYGTLSAAGSLTSTAKAKQELAGEAEVEISDKIYLGAKLTKVPDELSLLRLMLKIKGNDADVSIDDIFDNFNFDGFPTGSTLPGLNLSEKILTDIDTELARTQDELTYSVTKENDKTIISFTYNTKGLTSVLNKERDEIESSTSNEIAVSSYVVGENSSLNFTIKLDSGYFLSSLSTDAKITSLDISTTRADTTTQMKVTDISSTTNLSLVLGGTVGEIKNKDTEYKEDIGKQIDSIVETIKAFIK